MAAGAPSKDPAFIARTLEDLALSGEEFPVKVEGTRTLPYSAILVKQEPDTRQIVIKLVRPLPPALAPGAPFELVFATQGKRFEGRIHFLGREGYLQYRFQGPATLMASDRRLWKRYPIRPRENFLVAAQDSEMPGHGLAGPLLNLSLGGLSFRVDRMVRLEDGMPLRPAGYLFDRGMTLSFLRIRGLLPKGEVLEARGQVMRVHEGDSEIHLSIQFSGLGEADRVLLARFLETRERQSSPASGGFSAAAGRSPGGSGSAAVPAAEAAPEVPEEEAEPLPLPLEAAGLEGLRRLDRRCARLLLVGPPGEDRERTLRILQAAGFWRLACAPELFEAHAQCREAGAAPFRALLVDLEPSRAEGLESLGAVRNWEPLLRSFGPMPVAFLTRTPDPMLELLGREDFKAIAQEEAVDRWVERLDGLLGL